MSIFSEPPEPAMPDYGPGKQYFLVNSDQLRQLVIDWSPEIHHDVNRMEDLIRQMVDTDRAKAGLDNPKGTLTLWPNKNKKGANSPDMLGSGSVQGRVYRAAAWFSGDDNIKISILPPSK